MTPTNEQIKLEKVDELLEEVILKVIESFDDLQDTIRRIHGGELCDCGLGQTFCDKTCTQEETDCAT